MFDFTPVSKAVGLCLAGYFLLLPVAAIALVVSHYTVHQDDAVVSVLTFLNWPLPACFTAGSAVLVADFYRRLWSSRLSTTQVASYRMSAVLMILGTAFSLTSGHWWPIVVSVVGLVAVLLPTGGKAIASEWERS